MLRAWEIAEELAEGIGPRRPTSSAEARAAHAVARRLRTRGIQVSLEPIAGTSTFAAPLGLMVVGGLALSGSRGPRNARTGPRGSRRAAARRLWARRLLGSGLALAASAEARLVRTPVSDLCSRKPSQNLVARVPARGRGRRTVCLVGHLDSSRSGLLFHPRISGRLEAWFRLQGAALGVCALSPWLPPTRATRAVVLAAQAVLAAGIVLLAERELCGADVPGANDNASGSAVATQLVAEVHARPLEGSNVVLLLTGCEEAGLMGVQQFLRSRDTRGWVFVNFDGVGAPGTLRYLAREGFGPSWQADRLLAGALEAIARQRPELGLRAQPRNAGLTYDATPILARGGRAVTLSVQNGTIPNYHRPTDTMANLDPAALDRALTVGRHMLAAIERGEVDLPTGP
ncbi:MAG: M28 family metallopeptidase [Solirubrobacterales bacterium]